MINFNTGQSQVKSQLKYENDNLKSFGVLTGNDIARTDEDYSFGLNFDITSPKLSNTFYSKRIIEKTILKKYSFPKSHAKLILNKVGGVSLYCEGYTPRNIKSKVIQLNERPYFSIFAANYHLSYLLIDKEQKHGPKIFSTALRLGFIGIDVAKSLQSLNHSLLNNNNTRTPWLPEGWPNQISNGGEPTILIENKLKYLVFSNSIDRFFFNQNANYLETANRRFFEFTFGAQNSIGYITSIGAQTGGRIGILNNRNWSSEIDAMNISTNLTSKKRKFECYIQSQLTTNYEFYNVTLSGQFRKSNYTIPSNDIIHFIYTFQNNINFNYPGKNKYILFSYNFYTYRSSIIKNAQYSNGTHEWGGIYVGAIFSFSSEL